MEIDRIKALAENNDASAQNDLGIAYMTGDRIAVDEHQGVYWFHRASTQGNPEAMANLGKCFLLGKGTKKDISSGLFVMESAFLLGVPDILTRILDTLQSQDVQIEEIASLANKRNSQAEWVLGLCYDHGICMEEDHVKALELFKNSTDKDNPVALWILARFIARQEDSDLLYAKHCYDRIKMIAEKQVGGMYNRQIWKDAFDVETRLRKDGGLLLMKVIPECTTEGKPKDQYVKDLFDGKLFMRSLDQFGDITRRDSSSDNDFRGDILEGYSESFGCGYNPHAYVTDKTGNIIMDGQLGSIDILALRKKVFCLAAIDYYKPQHAFLMPSAKMKKFGRYAVIIKDVEEFIRRIHIAFDKCREDSGGSYRLAYGRVSYDVDLYRDMKFDEFHKSISYSWQNEFRISMDFSDGRFCPAMLDDVTDFAKMTYPGRIEIDDNPISLSDWLYFEIGDIRDICECIEIDDLFNGTLSLDLKKEPEAIRPYETPHEPRPTFCKAVSAFVFPDGSYRLAVSKEAFYVGLL